MDKEILETNNIRFDDKIKIIMLMAEYKKLLLHPENIVYIPPDEEEAIKEYENDIILNKTVNTLYVLFKEKRDE